MTPQQRAQMAASGNAGMTAGFIQNVEPRGGPVVSKPFANSNHPGRRAVSKVGDRTLYNRNSVGGTARANQDELMRGASLQPGGGTGNSGGQ
jgi:hypothetical protein